MALIERTRVKFDYRPESVGVQAVKDEILARPLTPYVETPLALKVERMDALERRLKANKTG